MGVVHTRLVFAKHSYTRSKTPWIMDEHKSVYGKLIHYLSGGGMRTFGRSVGQEEARRKHLRFLIASALLAVAWLVLYLV